MNVVYSSSDSYSEICGVSLTSLLFNNKDSDEINIFIVDNGISKLNKEKLVNTASNFHRNVIFLPKINLEELAKTEIYTGRWNIATFFRLYLGLILPDTIKKVIYLDCDMIIRHSLKDIFEMDLGECSVAAVDDCRSDLYRVELGNKPGTTYVNNGFLLINLEKWRSENTEAKFTEFINSRFGNCTYMDQAPLNAVLGKSNQIYELPAKYNAQRIFFDFSYKQLLRLRKPEYHLDEKSYNEANVDPIIVHFTPTFLSGTRPWQKHDKHPFAKEYNNYKNMSLWSDSDYRKDDRKFLKKLMTLICKMTPKFLMIPIMSYLHSTWYPKKRIKIYKKNAGIK